MNYYIQGNIEKADQIKAAFEKLGYDTTGHLFTAKSVLYFTLDGGIRATTCNCTPAIIKTHPDYQELGLPIQPKFKVGDWIVRGEGFVYEPSLITEIRDYYICELLNGERVTYTLNDVHKNFHLWAIEDAKDGDIIGFNDCTHNDGSYIDWVGIYKEKADAEKSHFFHCVITSKKDFRISILSWRVFTAYPATKEQRDMFFAKMKEAGYTWDEKKKELHKIQPHYDISNFHAGMPVLVRADNSYSWDYSVFSRITSNEYWKFSVCNGASFTQCIPFNDDTKHLLGTTDPCDKQYINW